MSVKSGELLLLRQVADTHDSVHEDHEDHEGVVALLKANGFDVILAADEEACLARLRVQRPEVMLVCLTDSAITADTLANLRKAAPRVPLLLLADAASVSKVVPCLEQGADDYLMLPFGDPAILNYVVRDNIKRKRELKRRKLNEKMLARTNKTLLESLQVLEQDQQAGFRVQQGMMPDTPLVFDNLTFAHLIVPSLILSGDAIDYFELPDQRLLFYIADVSGHGAAGAIVTVVLKGLFQQLLSEYENLGITAANEILEWLNHELLAVRLEQHVTLFLGLVSEDRKTLEYGNAAHFPGTIIHSEEGTEYLELGGLPLGIAPRPGYVCCQRTLPDNFTLVMFSDGVFEIMPQEGLQAKEKHLVSLVNYTRGEVDSIAEKLGLNSVADIPDDIAIFTVTKTG
jgi:sigma-B regulation protein RsbU (phosphoserine phosphatase)